jgi:hypothetical protein
MHSQDICLVRYMRIEWPFHVSTERHSPPPRLKPGVLLCVISPAGCCEPPRQAPPVAPQADWSDRQEVIYQLREVIRYEDERQRQRLEELQALSLPVTDAAADYPGTSADNGQQQDNR